MGRQTVSQAQIWPQYDTDNALLRPFLSNNKKQILLEIKQLNRSIEALNTMQSVGVGGFTKGGFV